MVTKKKIGKLSTTLYTKGLASVWRKASPKGPLIILSPYLTSRTADQVLASTGPSRVYTLFDAETFANGSSSLSTIKALMAAGHQVYCLPDVHAKIVMAPEFFASIGSQNLTRSGTLRREISATFTDKRITHAISDLIAPWFVDAWIVTPELLGAMEEEVKPLLKVFEAAQEQAEEAQARFEARRRQIAEESRREEERQREEAEEERRRAVEAHQRELLAQFDRRTRLLRLQRYVGGHSRQASDKVQCTVYTSHSPNRQDEKLYSLTASRNGILTKWVVNGETIELTDQYRYLCLVEDTGAIGWARVTTTRISFISPRRNDYNRFPMEAMGCDVTFEGQMWPGDESDSNIVVNICWLRWNPEVKVRGYFDGETLEILDFFMADDVNRDVVSAGQIYAWLENNREEFQRRIVPVMLSSYLPNEHKLAGPNVRRFFGDDLSVIDMRVMTSHGEPLLIAKRGWYHKVADS
ncbi:phospholipase D-like domain-containing protein [Cupriavidus metallidurans]|uniref:phospholipase D-like domain-containing protein n=1 Tax=Cupriavidus metallidurans TaxID=119219 RepID=UPI000CE04A2E|nr:phospholipase D-like domain-containing protein [Cupriavidus metallidurans]AVA36304.1 hypothetical protein C3Z06_23620 [Cupriavidus metallidurans]